jgi:hypothetical protein
MSDLRDSISNIIEGEMNISGLETRNVRVSEDCRVRVEMGYLWHVEEE